MIHRACAVVTVLMAVMVASAASEEVVLGPSADVTLYEGEGDLANGAGTFLFVGRTESQGGAAERRALLSFDIDGSIPDGATVTAVSLEITMSRTIAGPHTIELRRVLESWSEGPSNASGQEGSGASAQNGDATWVHRSFPGSTWSTEGGTLAMTASTSQSVTGNGAYTFGSSSQMVADVQGWLDDPSSNFGWAMVMPSPPVGSAKRFNSRENTSTQSRPKLTVTYEEGANEPELAERYVFPASNAPGSGTSFFITTTDVLNAGSATASFRVQRLERDADNSGALESALYTLEPGEVRRFDNVLGEAFGAAGENFAGGAAILSDSSELLVMTRTFNQVAEGSIGAALPGVPPTDLVEAGERVTVLFLSENDDFRSNIGFLNGVDTSVTVQWELFAPDGTSLAVGSRVLPPFGVTQINRVLRSFQPIEAAYAEIWTDTTGGSFAAYGSVLDEGTSDPTLVVPR